MPKDATPLGDEMAQSMPEPKFPRPKPGQESDEPGHSRPSANESEPASDIAHRPALPDHPQRMTADIEDGDADPVIDIGPGIDDGPANVRKQRG
jgi:hypothetical protein